MLIYVLDEAFLKKDVIDEFSSLIWTERYQAAGDFNLVVPASKNLVNLLREGTFLRLPGSDEVMIIETQIIDKGDLKLSGSSLLKFLNERQVRSSAVYKDKYWPLSGMKAGQTIGHIVAQMAAPGSPYTSGAINVGMNLGPIPGLTLGDQDLSGSNIAVAVPFGPMYDSLKSLAETYGLGMSLYLESAVPGSYSLKFKTYKGLDRTSTQSTNQLVRFSPALDSLRNTKELRSITGWKTAAYSYAPNGPDTLAAAIGIATASTTGAIGPSWLKERILQVFCDDITTDQLGGNAAALYAILQQRAVDALANNNYTRIVDGEVVPQSEFQFGTHYNLGDIIELQAASGLAQRARITEYIRVQDNTGEKAYPTVSVIT